MAHGTGIAMKGALVLWLFATIGCENLPFLTTEEKKDAFSNDYTSGKAYDALSINNYASKTRTTTAELFSEKNDNVIGEFVVSGDSSAAGLSVGTYTMHAGTDKKRLEVVLFASDYEGDTSDFCASSIPRAGFSDDFPIFKQYLVITEGTLKVSLKDDTYTLKWELSTRDKTFTGSITTKDSGPPSS